MNTSKKKRSLQDKISRVVIGLTILTLVIMTAVMFVMLYTLRGTFIDSSTNAGKKAEEMSSSTITEQIKSSLRNLAEDNANLANESLSNFQNSVKIVAETVTEIYNHPENYGERTVPLPDTKKDGTLSMQLLHSARIDLAMPSVRRELGLVANAQDMLFSINNNDPNMSSNYIATKSGLMIQADYIAARKFDEDGNILPYEAKERPWYKGASETQKPFFTSLQRDVHTGNLAVMCGVPFYRGDEFMGVAGAGMYLNELGEIVDEAKLGKTGYACMIDGEGHVIFASAGSEMFTPDPDNPEDLRNSDNKELAALMTKAVNGEEGIELLKIGDMSGYVAYASIETSGWSFLTVIPEDEVNEPTVKLMSELQDSTDESVAASNTQITIALIMVVVIVIVLCLVSLLLSKRASRMLVRQVNLLTAKVGEIKGDNLDFTWEEDTGDEIQVLAESFGSLTDRMKQYIRDITEITKEKERIGAELGVATRIQASMLPRDFGEFDGLGQFTLFASMDPAKEVGGDFYDFFLVDGDHIALVMADVSGKGVPAALFMVRAMTAIRTRALMGGGPSDILSDVNDQLCVGNEEELFVTVWLAILNFRTGEGLAANAGHEHPALRHEGGAYELVKYRHGPAVATMEGLTFREHEFKLEPGDTVFVYTDGVTEATDIHDELFGEERLTNALNINPGASPEELLPTVRAAIDTFVGEAPQFDDITMMAFHYL